MVNRQEIFEYVKKQYGTVPEYLWEPAKDGILTQTYGDLPGYHMNKKDWITMLLDGSVSEAKILDFLDLSYDLIDGKG